MLQVEGSIGQTEGGGRADPIKLSRRLLLSSLSPIRLDIAGNMQWGETKGMRGLSEKMTHRLREYRISFLHSFDCSAVRLVVVK